MTDSDREHIEDIAIRTYNCVLHILEKRFPDDHECVEFRIIFDPAADAPWTVRLGEVEHATFDVDGFTPAHLLKRFEMFGVAMVRSRIVMCRRESA